MPSDAAFHRSGRGNEAIGVPAAVGPAPGRGILTGGPGPAVAPSPSVWQRLWRRHAFRRAFYELLGLLIARRPGFQMLNCGHAAPAYPWFALPPEAEEERLGYQLYHRMVRARPITGLDVVEFGCGTGGGARFLVSTMAPRSYLATDASHLLVRAARRRGDPAALRFGVARAERVRLPANAFDVGLSVESISPLPDKAAFLAAAAHALRPGGTLFVTDFFYARPTSAQAASGFRAHIAASPLKLVREEDWTGNAVRAMELDSPRRLAAIARLPRFLRRAAVAFAGTTESPLYQQMCDGRAQHLHFELHKP